MVEAFSLVISIITSLPKEHSPILSGFLAPYKEPAFSQMALIGYIAEGSVFLDGFLFCMYLLLTLVVLRRFPGLGAQAAHATLLPSLEHAALTGRRFWSLVP